jgi:hypothetical protein
MTTSAAELATPEEALIPPRHSNWSLIVQGTFLPPYISHFYTTAPL